MFSLILLLFCVLQAPLPIEGLNCYSCPTENCTTAICQGTACVDTWSATATDKYTKQCLTIFAGATDILLPNTGGTSDTCAYGNDAFSYCMCSDDYCNSGKFMKSDMTKGKYTCEYFHAGTTSTCKGDLCTYMKGETGCYGGALVPMFFGANAGTKLPFCYTTIGSEEICYCQENNCNSQRPDVKYDNQRAMVECECTQGDKCNKGSNKCVGHACTYDTLTTINFVTKSCRNITGDIPLIDYCFQLGATGPESCICQKDNCNSDIATAISAVGVSSGATNIFGMHFVNFVLFLIVANLGLGCSI